MDESIPDTDVNSCLLYSQAGLCTGGLCLTGCRGLVGSVTASNIVTVASVIMFARVTWFVHKYRNQRKVEHRGRC